jgi:hypothetical protein
MGAAVKPKRVREPALARRMGLRYSESAQDCAYFARLSGAPIQRDTRVRNQPKHVAKGALELAKCVRHEVCDRLRRGRTVHEVARALEEGRRTLPNQPQALMDAALL